MSPLSKTNKYFTTPAELDRLVIENAIASSIFEGASLRSVSPQSDHKVSRAKTASSKKSAKSS